MESKIIYVAKVINCFLKERISYDYDGVLTKKKVQEEVRKLVESGKYDVYIISARDSKDGMISMAMNLGIRLQNVYATGSNEDKIKKVKSLVIKRHYDNNINVVNKLPYVGKLV